MKLYLNISLLWAAATALLLCGCTEEQPLHTDDNGNNGAQRPTVSVTLPLTVAPVENGTPNTATTPPTTRALESSYVTYVYVLQFDASGKNVLTSMVDDAYFTIDPLPIPALVPGTGYTIYVFAYDSDAPYDPGFTTSKLANLSEWETGLLCNHDYLEYFPMVGKLTNVTVEDLGNGQGNLLLNDASPAVVMRRIYAEVNLTVDIAGIDMNKDQYKRLIPYIYNTPIGAAYGWNAQTSTSTTFPVNPDNTSIGFTDTAVKGMEPTNWGQDYAAPKLLFKWLVPENRRGDVAGITDPTQRNSSNAPAYATFARIILSNESSGSEIYFDVYLGSGNLGNFDLVRNHVYNINVAIGGGDSFLESLVDTDARVSGKGFPIYLTDNSSDSPVVISPKSMESTSIYAWGPNNQSSGATSVYDGKDNVSNLIINGITNYPAAEYCYNQNTINNQGTWYLPAQAQLMLMYSYLHAIPENERPDTLGPPVWSSTESDVDRAWLLQFHSGMVNNESKVNDYFYVRCTRDGANTAYNTWKYPKVESSNTIVSRDAAGGIKTSALLTDQQKAVLKKVDASGSVFPNYDATNELNKVSAKFRVAKKNVIRNNSDLMIGGTDIYKECQLYKEETSGSDKLLWRVPTQRELMIIYLSASKLTGCDAFSQDAAYWSGANSSSTGYEYMECVNFKTGAASPMDATNEFDKRHLRCVRDL